MRSFSFRFFCDGQREACWNEEEEELMRMVTMGVFVS